MVSVDSFRALKSDFEELASDGFELPAWHDPTNFRTEAAAIRSRLGSMARARDRHRRRHGSAAGLTTIEALERQAKQYESVTTDAEGYLWTFEVPGGAPPKDREAFWILVKRFSLYAARAAVEAGVVETDASEDVKVFAWLGQLKAHRPNPHPSDADLIPCVIKASTLRCEELSMEANQTELTLARAAAITETSSRLESPVVIVPSPEAEAASTLAVAEDGTLRRAYFTVPQAAKRLQVCEATIRREIKSGRLDATNVGRAIRIPGTALAAYQRNQPPRK